MWGLGTLPNGHGGQAFSINDAGLVVGYMITQTNDMHAFLRSKDVMRDLGTLPQGKWSQAWAVSNSGHVVGVADVGENRFHAFMWTKGVMHDLGALPGGKTSWAFGVNSAGKAVGQADSVAVLFSEGMVRDLNSLIPSEPGWTLFEARAINASGLITGTGLISSTGTLHAYLLRPISPAGSRAH